MCRSSPFMGLIRILYTVGCGLGGWVKCPPIEWHLEGYPVLGPPCSPCRLKGCPVSGHPCSPWERHPNSRLQGYGVLPTPCSSCERVLLHLNGRCCIKLFRLSFQIVAFIVAFRRWETCGKL